MCVRGWRTCACGGVHGALRRAPQLARAPSVGVAVLLYVEGMNEMRAGTRRGRGLARHWMRQGSFLFPGGATRHLDTQPLSATSIGLRRDSVRRHGWSGSYACTRCRAVAPVTAGFSFAWCSLLCCLPDCVATGSGALDHTRPQCHRFGMVMAWGLGASLTQATCVCRVYVQVCCRHVMLCGRPGHRSARCAVLRQTKPALGCYAGVTD